MDEIREQLKDIHGSIDEMGAVQTEQHYILVEHQRRSAANEARLFVVENFYTDFKIHMAQLAGAIKLLKWMGGMATISLVIFQLIPYLKGL